MIKEMCAQQPCGAPLGRRFPRRLLLTEMREDSRRPAQGVGVTHLSGGSSPASGCPPGTVQRQGRETGRREQQVGASTFEAGPTWGRSNESSGRREAGGALDDGKQTDYRCGSRFPSFVFRASAFL